MTDVYMWITLWIWWIFQGCLAKKRQEYLLAERGGSLQANMQGTGPVNK